MTNLLNSETRTVHGYEVEVWYCSSAFGWYGTIFKPGDPYFAVTVNGVWNTAEELFAHAARELPHLGNRRCI
jgi:hypothetical protein